jgi:hypothetical protein
MSFCKQKSHHLLISIKPWTKEMRKMVKSLNIKKVWFSSKIVWIVKRVLSNLCSLIKCLKRKKLIKLKKKFIDFFPLFCPKSEKTNLRVDNGNERGDDLEWKCPEEMIKYHQETVNPRFHTIFFKFVFLKWSNTTEKQSKLVFKRFSSNLFFNRC